MFSGCKNTVTSSESITTESAVVVLSEYDLGDVLVRAPVICLQNELKHVCDALLQSVLFL